MLHGTCVPFDCDDQIYDMHGHIYKENPDGYTGRSCPMYRVLPDGTKSYIGTVTPYKSCNLVLTGVHDVEVRGLGAGIPLRPT